MKLSLISLSSLLSVAIAADPIVANPRDACAVACPAVELCCISACYDTPCPTAQQADDARRCVWNCPVGVGTPRDVIDHARCRENCIYDNYYSSTSTASSTSTTSSTRTTSSPSAPTSTSSSSSSSSTSASTSTFTSTATIHPTETGSGAAETTSSAASVNSQVQMMGGASVVGALGYVLAWVL